MVGSTTVIVLPLPSIEGVVDADAGGGVHLRQLVEVVGQLRAQAPEAEVVHADDEVAAELVAEDLPDESLIDEASTDTPGDERHARR